MGHGQNGRVRMRGADLQEAGDDARAEVVVRLAVVPAVAPMEPAGEASGKARLDLGRE